MQRFVDNVLAVTKESVKTITYESVNNTVKLINGASALLLTILPGKTSLLEGMQGWELKPTIRGPRLPRWMENGVSSFNQFIHELSVDTDASSSPDNSSREEDSDDDMCPASPLSQSSRVSHASSISKHGRLRRGWIMYTCSWILFPAKLFLAIVCCILFFPFTKKAGVSTPTENQTSSHIAPINKVQSLKNNIIRRAIDSRRGVIEDLHLALEVFIEAIFDVVHNAVHLFFSPMEALRRMKRGVVARNDENVASGSPEQSTTAGEDDGIPSESNTSFQHSLNTDARTCQDVITELGYPYEAIHVATADGYILLLERIPRRDARKAVYLQHGILDSSMGWVSNGVVGSPAFAAYDQGYDIFLGNFRGLVSREHINKKISSREYWRYSINEHGTRDIPSMVEKIHQVKTSELKLSQPDIEEETKDDQPYKLCAICHSLGGAAMLMYVVTHRIEEKPHRLSRLILLSPAGFHGDFNFTFSLIEYLLLLLAPILSPFVPAFYIPTRFFRMLLNKLARDFNNYPAIGGLVQTLMSYSAGGDSSNWIGVLGLPHYNMNDMPGLAFNVALHLAQIKRSGKFQMYDYGSATANLKMYGSPVPLDLGQHYELIDIPIDLVAGRKDKVIQPSMVRKHYKLMKDSGVDVAYREFEYAHLDFTFSHHEELLTYVMSCLLPVEPIQKRQLSQKAMELKKKGRSMEEGQIY